MRRSLVHVFTAALLLTGLVFLEEVGFLAPFLDIGRRGTETAITPLVAGFSKLKKFADMIAELKDLAARNEILTKQVEKLTYDVSLLEKTRQENRVLREALGFAAESELRLLPAEIISWDQLYGARLATLNRGTKHGVAKGKAVVVSGGILVGVIVEASEATSQMEILTSSAIAVNAETLPGGATGIVRGEHGLGLTFNLVSQNEEVSIYDRVVTSGLGGAYPKGLLIGEIGKIDSAESELFQKASILPAANLRNLRAVFVIE